MNDGLRPEPILDGADLAKTASIWRYMSVGKYLNLLQQQSLYFSRIDRLGDEWECTWPHQSMVANIPSEQRGKHGVTKLMHNMMFVSCWHLGTRESLAMWKLYAQIDEGIAIRTTVGSLLDQFDCGVFYSPVRYVDFEADPYPSLNHLHLAFIKRVEFAHEREFRIVHWDRRSPLPEPRESRSHACKTHEVVQEVVIAPRAPSYLLDVVRAASSHHGITAPLRASALAGEPIYL